MGRSPSPELIYPTFPSFTQILETYTLDPYIFSTELSISSQTTDSTMFSSRSGSDLPFQSPFTSSLSPQNLNLQDNQFSSLPISYSNASSPDLLNERLEEINTKIFYSYNSMCNRLDRLINAASLKAESTSTSELPIADKLELKSTSKQDNHSESLKEDGPSHFFLPDAPSLNYESSSRWILRAGSQRTNGSLSPITLMY